MSGRPTAEQLQRALERTLNRIFFRHWCQPRLLKADNDNHFDEGPRYA